MYVFLHTFRGQYFVYLLWILRISSSRRYSLAMYFLQILLVSLSNLIEYFRLLLCGEMLDVGLGLISSSSTSCEHSNLLLQRSFHSVPSLERWNIRETSEKQIHEQHNSHSEARSSIISKKWSQLPKMQTWENACKTCMLCSSVPQHTQSSSWSMHDTSKCFLIRNLALWRLY